MGKEYEYFIEQDNNCAESTLRVADEKYHLGIGAEEVKLVSAFGAGMGCGKTCGALCGALAVIGRLMVNERAHATEGFGELCAEFVHKFEDELGALDCETLKAMYRTEELRCLKTVELATKVLDEFLAEHTGRGKKEGT